MGTWKTAKIRNAICATSPEDRESAIEGLLTSVRPDRDVYNTKGVPHNTEFCVTVHFITFVGYSDFIFCRGRSIVVLNVFHVN